MCNVQTGRGCNECNERNICNRHRTVPKRLSFGTVTQRVPTHTRTCQYRDVLGHDPVSWGRGCLDPRSSCLIAELCLGAVQATLRHCYNEIDLFRLTCAVSRSLKSALRQDFFFPDVVSIVLVPVGLEPKREVPPLSPPGLFCAPSAAPVRDDKGGPPVASIKGE